jgi:hypothetical protein
VYPVEDQSNCMEFYPDAGEEIPKDLPSKMDQGSGKLFILMLIMHIT